MDTCLKRFICQDHKIKRDHPKIASNYLKSVIKSSHRLMSQIEDLK